MSDPSIGRKFMKTTTVQQKERARKQQIIVRIISCRFKFGHGHHWRNFAVLETPYC